MTTPYSRIRTVNSGEQITRPGIYIVPIRRYHSDPNLFPGHSVSSTGLRLFTQTCPAKYWAHCVHNPLRIFRSESEALRMGKAIHALLLERDLPSTDFAVHDFGNFSSNEGKDIFYPLDENGNRIPKVNGWVTKKGYSDPEGNFSKLFHAPNGRKYGSYVAYKKEWKFIADWFGLTIVGPKDLRLIANMAKALSQDPLIKDGLLEGQVELTICYQDPKTGIWIKVRPDVIPIDGMFADYKSVRSAHEREVVRSVENYGYDQQFAIIMDALTRVLGLNITSAAIVGQEKEEPFLHHILTMTPHMIHRGRQLNRKALDGIAHCLKEGDWPSYGGGTPTTIGVSNWREERFLKMIDNDELPDVEPLEELIGKVN